MTSDLCFFWGVFFWFYFVSTLKVGGFSGLYTKWILVFYFLTELLIETGGLMKSVVYIYHARRTIGVLMLSSSKYEREYVRPLPS